MRTGLEKVTQFCWVLSLAANRASTVSIPGRGLSSRLRLHGIIYPFLSLHTREEGAIQGKISEQELDGGQKQLFKTGQEEIFRGGFLKGTGAGTWRSSSSGRTSYLLNKAHQRWRSSSRDRLAEKHGSLVRAEKN